MSSINTFNEINKINNNNNSLATYFTLHTSDINEITEEAYITKKYDIINPQKWIIAYLGPVKYFISNLNTSIISDRLYRYTIKQCYYRHVNHIFYEFKVIRYRNINSHLINKKILYNYPQNPVRALTLKEKQDYFNFHSLTESEESKYNTKPYYPKYRYKIPQTVTWRTRIMH